MKKDCYYSYIGGGGGVHAIANRKQGIVFAWRNSRILGDKNLVFLERILECLNACDGFDEPIIDSTFLRVMAGKQIDEITKSNV